MNHDFINFILLPLLAIGFIGANAAICFVMLGLIRWSDSDDH